MSEDDIGIAGTQYTLPCSILGEDVEDFNICPLSSIEGLWRDFRFPEGFAPRSVRFGDAFDPVEYMRVQSGFMAKNVKDIEEIVEADVQAKKAEREAAEREAAEREANELPPATAKVSTA